MIGNLIINATVFMIIVIGYLIIITKNRKEGFIPYSNYNKVYSERMVYGDKAPKFTINSTNNFELYPYDERLGFEQKTNNMKENTKSLKNPPNSGCRRINYYCSSKVMK